MPETITVKIVDSATPPPRAPGGAAPIPGGGGGGGTSPLLPPGAGSGPIPGPQGAGGIGGALRAGAGLLVLAASAKAVKGVFDKLVSEADRLAEFSPELALVKAETELKNIEGDFRKAERFGPQLAEFERTRQKSLDRIGDSQDQLLELLLPIATVGLETFNDALSIGNELSERLTDTIGSIGEKLDLSLEDIVRNSSPIPFILDLIKEWLGIVDDEDAKLKTLLELFRAENNPVRERRLAAMPAAPVGG